MFDVCSSNEVLINVPAGKQYLLREMADVRLPQKGPTCWYYVLSYVRLRYGKECDAAAPNFVGRKQEKIISTYRKNITQSSQRYHKNKYLLNLAPDSEKRNNLIFYLKERVFHLLEVMKELGIAHDAAYERLLVSTNDENFLNQYLAELGNAFESKVWEIYKLKISAWRPAYGIKGLINCLKKEGPLVVYGFFGVPYYRNLPRIIEQKVYPSGPYVFCGWPAHEYFIPAVDACHGILIVGAKVINYKNWIFFLDTNTASYPGQARVIYRMTYEELVERILTLNQDQEENIYDLSQGYAVCANNYKSLLY